MCDFRGSSRRNRSFLAEDLGHWLRFFSLEAENDAVLWLGNQLLTAATNHSDCLYEALVHRLAYNGAPGFTHGTHTTHMTYATHVTHMTHATHITYAPM
jgi:hypothetical protein